MTEDRSYQLPPGDNNLLGSTASNGIASGCCDFNKYDPYVERIRTLFVPSLEPRIHSCLETFVYRRESGQRSDPPYLKRCLDAAATLRDPVEAFCTKWRDSGFVETMLAGVVKFLISNGPIDCLLNSIVLNNRLNKVCRDLDALGVKKDLLRYLAVWNYINERDYWLEEDIITSTSKSDESRDFTDRRSDLDVEVGSVLDSRRNDRSLRRAFKRRATEDSPDDQDRSGRASKNGHDNIQSPIPFPSRLSIDSSNPEGSRSSSARKKIRSSQAHPCRPSTCPNYRSKNFVPLSWAGKTLKLQLCKTSLASLDHQRERRRSSKLSELNLPCKRDDLISEIFKANPTLSRQFAQGRKKLKAGVTSVCDRVNETLGKIDRRQVGRCRLHLEILPGCVSFRLIERDRDGSEVCLFSDRVPLDARQFDPGRSSGSKPRQIGEQTNADEAELTIYKNSGFSPADDESRIVRNLEEETAIKTEPDDVLLRLCSVNLEATARKNVEQLIEQGRREASRSASEGKVDEAMCCCNPSFACQRKESNEDEGSDPKSHPQASTGERSLNRPSGNADDGRDNLLDDNPDRTARNEEKNEAVHGNDLEGLARRELSISSNENLNGVQKCTCSVSSHCMVDHLDRAIGADLIQAADRQVPDIADSHAEIADSEDAAEKVRRAKLHRDSSSFVSAKKYQPDVPTDNQDTITCACPLNCICANEDVEENQAEECDAKCSCDSCSREDEPRALKKTEIVRMSSFLKSRTETLDSAAQEVSVSHSTQRSGALVSASDELQFCCTAESQPEECESKCWCDTCSREDESRPLKKTEIIRMSSLLERQTKTLDSTIQNSPNPNSTQRNGALVSASDEFQGGCARVQSSGFHSQNPEFRQGPSMRSETNATKTMSFIEGDSQGAQPNRGSAVQQTSSNMSSKEHPVVSARLSLIKYQPDVPTDNRRDEIACACPSDCTCPNRITEENQPEECDSKCCCDTCRHEDESRSLKKTEIIRMSSLLWSHTDTLDSVQDSPDPTSTLKNGAFLVPAYDQFQRGCTEHQDPEIHEGPSTKSDSPLESKAAETISFVEAESPPPQPDHGSTAPRTSSAKNKSRRNISAEERPIVASRLSRPKGQRINILIEVCPESESSTERTRRNESANDVFRVTEDATAHRKSRRHSVEHETIGKQVLLHLGEDTEDEFLGQPRSTFAGVRSPSRPLESLYYLPPFRPPSSMRNPIVYGTSTNPSRPSIGETDERFASRGERRRCDSRVTKNRHGSIQRNDPKNNEEEEMPKNSSRLPSKSDALFSSGLRTNVGHAVSASSMDRMKHLIRTKLRRMLLERDKATNTPKTTLTNKKYRVSAPGAKNDRSLFGQQSCRTIWESRSGSDSVCTSRSFASDESKCSRKLFRSTGNARVSDSRFRDSGGTYRPSDGENSKRHSENGRRFVGNESAPAVDSEANFLRLSGGNDLGSRLKRHENLRKSENRGNRCASRYENGTVDETFMNHGLKRVPEEIGNSSAGKWCEASGKKIPDESAELYGISRVGNNFPRLAGGSDFGSKMKRHENMHSSAQGENRRSLQNNNARIDRLDEKFTYHSSKKLPEEIGDSSAGNLSGKKILDDSPELYRKLDCSRNSTSRHICLFEFDRSGSSNDETESVGCCRSPRKTRLPEVRRAPGRNVDARPKKLMASRARDSRFSAPRDKSAMSDSSIDTNNVSVSGVRRFCAVGNIDQDLRKKLSQYVSLCKNVKYSLLKRLRPDDIYEVSRTSIPCCDRYKFGDT